MVRISLSLAVALASCASQPAPAQPAKPFVSTPIAKFEAPWAMTFLPDGRMLVTEKGGTLKIGKPGAPMTSVGGVPKVDAGGQGGLGDVVIHPDYRNTGFVYLSFVEAGSNDTRGAAVGRGKLVEDARGARLEAFQVLWRQEPKVTGRGHFGHRLAFGPDGMMYISSGERQKFTPAQDMNASLGKIIRLTDTGMVPSDNPFYDQGRVTSQVWSFGHRNPLGIAFDAQGRLWEQEMGPKGGDEVNLIVKAKNYGYPIVSNGDHYDGLDIPDHSTRPEFEAPKVSWNPVISPAGLIVYSGAMFPAWKGNLFIGGLSSEALIRVSVDGDTAKEAERFKMGARIREVEQGPDGAIWILEDEGRLLKLTPKP